MAGRKERDSTLEQDLDFLGSEISTGRMHLWLWRGLSSALRSKPQLARMTPGFFSLTLRAHIHEAVLHAARLFDKKKNTVNLDMLLEKVSKNEGAFMKAASSQVRREILPRLRRKLGQLRREAKPVLDRRHTFLAHLDRGSVTDYVGVAEKSRMTIEQLDGIYRKAGEIVNEVSLPFRDSMRLFEAFGWDDFKTVLEYMERGRQAILDDLKSGRLKKP